MKYIIIIGVGMILFGGFALGRTVHAIAANVSQSQEQAMNFDMGPHANK